MAGEILTRHPVPRNTEEPRKPFWEKPISRRTAITGTATVAGGLGLVALLNAVTGRGHSEEKQAAQVSGNAVSKPDAHVVNAGSQTNGEFAVSQGLADIVLKNPLLSLDGKETTVKELAAKGPLVLVTWSSSDNSVSESWIPKINTKVYPQFAGSNVQFLAVETWVPLPNLKKHLTENHDYLQGLSFPIVVATGKDRSVTPLYHTGTVILIEKGGGNMREFGTVELDQLIPAIAKLAASGN